MTVKAISIAPNNKQKKKYNSQLINNLDSPNIEISNSF